MAWTELIERRTAKAKFYSDGEGHILAEYTLHDQHYQDASGVWQEVNEALEDDGADGFTAKAGRMRHLIRGKDDGTRRWYPRRNVLTEYVQFGIPQYWSGTAWVTLPLGTPTREGNTLIWDRPTYALKVTVNWHKLKLDVTLKTSAAARRIRWPISLTGLTRSGWTLLSGGTVVGQVDAPTAEDALGNAYAVTASVVSGYVEFVANLTGAVFPVIIDPTLTLDEGEAGADNDTYLSGYGTTNNYGSHAQLVIDNWLSQVGLIKFDCSSIPSDATCDSATLSLWSVGTAGYVEVHSIASGNAAWIEGTRSGTQALSGEPCWDALAANGSGGVTTAWAGSAGLQTSGTDFEATLLGSADDDPISANTEVPVTLTATRVEGWFGATNTNYGLLLRNSGGYGATFHSSDGATAVYRPKLVVEYTEAASGIIPVLMAQYRHRR